MMTRARMGLLFRFTLCGGLLGLPLATAACGEEDGTVSGNTSCGDGVCSIETCESSVRCQKDCGTCIGDECNPSDVGSSCGAACETSCDCPSAAQFCSADYGLSPGVCTPIDCIDCSPVDACQFSPDENGRCDTVTCG